MRRRRRRRWEGGGGGDSATVAVHQQRWDHSHYITVCRLEKWWWSPCETDTLNTSQRTSCFDPFAFVVRLWVLKSSVLNLCEQPHEKKDDGTKSVQCTCRHELSVCVRPFFFSASVSRLKGSYIGQLYPSCLACRQRQTDLQWATVCVSLVLTQMLRNTDCPVTALHSQNNSLQLITDNNNV